MSNLLGVFILGVLAGWVVEWVFVRLFVPNPKKKVEAALQASRKEIENLQKKNSELQAALTTATVQLAAVPVTAQEIVPVVVEAATEPVLTSNDDLTRLAGIGPKLAQAMNAVGISTYAQLAKMAVVEINERLATSNIRYSKTTAESWAAQAELAAAGDWEGLKNYQESLKS